MSIQNKTARVERNMIFKQDITEVKYPDTLRFNIGFRMSELSDIQLCILIKHTAEYITAMGKGDIEFVCKHKWDSE